MKIIKLKLSILFIIFFATSLAVQAQILKEKDKIIEELGSNYELDTTDDGVEYIVYEKEFKTDASGKYKQQKVFYFAKVDNGMKICYQWKIFEPASETNANVSYFKKQGYVEVDYLQWKDYEHSILYDLNVKDDLCIITAVYNESK